MKATNQLLVAYRFGDEHRPPLVNGIGEPFQERSYPCDPSNHTSMPFCACMRLAAC